MNRLKGPVNDDELGRWTVSMRDHYGYLLGIFKHVEKECTALKRRPRGKRV
jgi:hypothetical protein